MKSYSKSAEFFAQALDLFEKLNETQTELYATCLNNYGYVLYMQGDDDLKALQKLRLSVQILEEQVSNPNPALSAQLKSILEEVEADLADDETH